MPLSYLSGQNTYGQIGVGTKRNVYEPILVRELIYDSKLVSVSAGGSHTLAVCDTTGPGSEVDRTVFSWGNGGSGRLGLCKTSWGTDARDQMLPRRIRYLTNKRVIRAYAGGAHSIALVRARAFPSPHTPTTTFLVLCDLLPLLRPFLSVQVGEDETGEEQAGGKNSSGGKIFVWGEGKDGQLGNDHNFEVHRPQLLKELIYMFVEVGVFWNDFCVPVCFLLPLSRPLAGFLLCFLLRFRCASSCPLLLDLASPL
jgi:hypothetical protein